MVPKFRLWDKQELEFVQLLNNMVLNHDGTIEGIEYEMHGEGNVYNDISYFEVMHSTGLKDKNGVEIFEGDVVKDIDGEIGYIVFLKQEMGYVIVYKNRDRRLGHRNGIEVHHLELIGNIYESGDLL